MAVLTLSGLMAGNALAQADKPKEAPALPSIAPGAKPSARPDRLGNMTQVLNLNEDQRTKIKPILEEEAKQIKVLKEDRSIAFQERGTKYREIRKAADEKIRAVLTPEQAEKWDKMRGLGGGNKPPAPKVPAAAPEKK